MKHVSIGEVAMVRSGFAFKSRDWLDAGVPVVKIGNVKAGWVSLDGCSFVSEEVAKEAAEFELHPGDVLVSMTGHIGEVARVRNEGRMLLNQRVGRFIVRDLARLDREFLYYCLQESELKAAMVAHAYGVAQPNISPSLIEQQTIPLPPLSYQRRVVSVLSAYDDLIANNQRRIQIHEQIARALYREWFVEFRFPGHEKVRLVESPLGPIPEGWTLSEFRDLFDIRYGKTLPKTEIADSGPYPVYGAGDVIGYYDRMLCPEKRALVTSRGNGSGTVWRTREAAFVTNNSLIVRPREEHRHWDYSFIELLLKHSNVMAAKTGSAQPQVTIENLNYLKAAAPPKGLVERFCRLATPIYEQVDVLFRACGNLRRTRDLLLPRLLSGQVALTDTAA